MHNVATSIARPRPLMLKWLALALLSTLVACSPAAFVDMEVVDEAGEPVAGVLLMVHDNWNYKFKARADERGCIHTYGVPTRMGGRDWRMKVAAPSMQSAEFRMHASGRHAYVVTLRPEGAGASSAQEVDALPSCTD